MKVGRFMLQLHAYQYKFGFSLFSIGIVPRALDMSGTCPWGISSFSCCPSCVDRQYSLSVKSLSGGKGLYPECFQDQWAGETTW